MRPVFNQTKRHALSHRFVKVPNQPQDDDVTSVTLPRRISSSVWSEGGSAKSSSPITRDRGRHSLRSPIHMAYASRPNPLEEDDDAEEEVCQLLPPTTFSWCAPLLFVLYSWIRDCFLGATFRWFYSSFFLGKVFPSRFWECLVSILCCSLPFGMSPHHWSLCLLGSFQTLKQLVVNG